MAKSNFPGVQHLSREIFRQARRIDCIAQHWVTDMVKMHPDLMSPSTVQPALDQARLISRAQDAIFGLSCASMQGSHAHPLSVDRMSPDFFFDRARLFAQFTHAQAQGKSSRLCAQQTVWTSPDGSHHFSRRQGIHLFPYRGDEQYRGVLFRRFPTGSCNG